MLLEFRASNWEATQEEIIYETTQTQYIPWCGGYRSYTVYPIGKGSIAGGCGERHLHRHGGGQKNADVSEYPEGRCSVFQGKDRKQIGDWKKGDSLFLAILIERFPSRPRPEGSGIICANSSCLNRPPRRLWLATLLTMARGCCRTLRQS